MSLCYGASWGRARRLQYAALPYRRYGLQTMVLLITTRRTNRWIIPRGWAEPHVLPPSIAATEAYEEAGVIGVVDDAALGTYDYRKRMPGGNRVTCRVDVFALHVSGFAGSWPEQGQRRYRWVTPEDAALLVREPGLAALVQRFGERTNIDLRQGVTTTVEG